MATKNISSWDEFKTALTETITEDTTYEIQNDMDVSDDILTGRINCVSAFNKIFNGNSHKINGITTYTNLTGVFYFNLLSGTGTFTFNSIHFSNFQVVAAAGGLFHFYTSVSNSVRPTFNDCYFNGECHIFARGSTGSNASRANFNRCSINIGITQIAYSDGYNPLYMTNCYIIIKSLSNLSLSTSAIGHPLFNTLTNCYIGGKITISTASGTSSSYYRPIFAISGYNTVINMDITVTATTGGIYLFTGTTATCLFNNDKYNGKITPTFVTGTAVQSNYKLTDEQIKNSSYIANNTTFPITV